MLSDDVHRRELCRIGNLAHFFRFAMKEFRPELDWQSRACVSHGKNSTADTSARLEYDDARTFLAQASRRRESRDTSANDYHIRARLTYWRHRIFAKAPATQRIAGARFPESGRPDLNRGPPAPKAGAIPGYATPRVRASYYIRPSARNALSSARNARLR